MVEYQSGLEACFADFQNKISPATNSSGTPDIIIAEQRDIKITQLSFFVNEQARLKTQLAKSGISDVPKFSQTIKGKDVLAARVEMGKIWLISKEHIVTKDAFYALDLSSSRNVVRLAGARAEDVMARICAVDFRDKSRSFYATSMHHVGIHVHHHDGVFDIYMPRSFGQSLTEMLIDISRQYHVQMA